MANITVLGLPKAMAFMKAASMTVIAKANDGVHEAGVLMEGEVKASIAGNRGEPRSVDTGAFKSSIKVDNNTKLQSKVSTNLPYGAALEHGTSRIPARNHFSNSANRNKHAVTKLIQDEVAKV